MTRDLLGELEHRVMLTLLRLGEGAYTAPVVLELERRTGRPVRAAAVYIALRRLEEKGLVVSEMRSPGPGGGRDRRHFAITTSGLERLRGEHAIHQRLVDGLDGLLGGAS